MCFQSGKKNPFVIFMQERDYIKQVTISILDLESSVTKPSSAHVWYCMLSTIYKVYSLFLPQALQIFTGFTSPVKYLILKDHKGSGTCFKCCLEVLRCSEGHFFMYLRSLHNGPLKEVMLQSQLNPSHCCKHTPWFAQESSWHVVLGPNENTQKRTCTSSSKERYFSVGHIE